MSLDTWTLDTVLSGLTPLDEGAMRVAQERMDQLTKPPGSLGKLEQLAAQCSGIAGEVLPKKAGKVAVVVMAADHGVCAEGVSAFPQEVTGQMLLNFAEGGAAVNVLARQHGADVYCVDIGCLEDSNHPRVLSRKVRAGTGNIAVEPAMSRQEAVEAIEQGIRLVGELTAEGYDTFVTGEMGIGNTTPSAAILAALGHIAVEEAVGRGTGIDDERLAHKRRVVAQAIAKHRPVSEDPVDVLANMGGLEIAGLVGVILGAAYHRRAVVLDGFISTAAALVAVRLAPLSRGYLIASHKSDERGHKLMLELLALQPMLHLDMRLGEGTGGVLCLPLLESARRILHEMATFESAAVSGAVSEGTV